MPDLFFPVRLSKPPTILSYNKDKEWWEGDTPLGHIATWLEIDKEQERAYINCFTLTEEGELGNYCKGVYGILFTERGHEIITRRDQAIQRNYFDLDNYFDRSCWENVYCLPVLFYSTYPTGSPWCIPERPELLYVKPFEPDLEFELERQQDAIEYNIEKARREQQAQEQKEQAEKDWEEWEKRQSEENDK